MSRVAIHTPPLGRHKLYRVSGHSMYPLLKDGETVQIKPLNHDTGTVEPGEIIIFKHPFRPIDCVKRVKKVNGDGSVEVWGTNIESEDAIGSINRQAVIGKVRMFVHPEAPSIIS